MSLLDSLRYHVRTLLHPGAHARDAERELRFHLDLDAAQRQHEGATPGDAECAARRQFGNRTAVAEAMRRAAGLAWLDTTRQDLAFALRGIRRAPGFALVAMATLALGIGAATAIYSVVDGALIEPLPIAHPDRVLELAMTRRIPPTDAMESSVLPVSIPQYRRWLSQLREFSTLAAATPTHYESVGKRASHALLSSLDDHTHAVRVASVSANFFALAGVAPRAGPGFVGAHDPSVGREAMLSDSAWRQLYHRDAHVVGRTLELEGVPYSIVGVMPPGFTFPNETQVWTDWRSPDFTRYANERTFMLTVFGRLRDGVSPETGRAEVRTAFATDAGVAPSLGDYQPFTPTVRDALVARASVPLAVMAICVGVLLLIAAANVTNMLLVRGASRQHEVAVRLALGAGRRRLVRQFVTESLVLAAGGAIVGLGVAWGITRFVVSQQAIDIPQRTRIGLNASAVVVGLALAILVGVVCGMSPALSISRDALEGALRQESKRHSAGASRRRMRDALVGFEVAMSVILLAGTGLLLQSVRHLMELRPGVTTEGLLTAGLDPSLPARDTVAIRTIAGTIAERLRAIPGVSIASVSSTYPFGGAITFESDVQTSGTPATDSSHRYTTIAGIDADYFHALGVRILRGRAFTSADFARKDVAIVNEEFVNKYFHGGDPVGKRLRMEDSPELEIVGEVQSTRSSGMRAEADPATYVPLGAFGVTELGIVMRIAHGDPLRLIPAVKTAIRDAAPAATLFDLGTLSTLLADVAAPQHEYLLLLAGFALAALVVTAVGLYGVISYTVAQRTREIGIRMALGATPDAMGRKVAREGLGVTLGGVVIGVLLSLAATRVLRALLFGIAPGDPTVLAVVALLLIAVALAASWLPARRAASVDPLIAIRTE